MTFEEKLLMELKAEVSERAARQAPRPARRITGRRLVTGAAIVGITAAAVAAIPVVGRSEATAYAVTRNADGSITVRIKELRDAERLEADLARRGVRADITYLEPGEKCATVPNGELPTPEEREKLRKQAAMLPVRGTGFGVFAIVPRNIAAGQTLVIWVGENGPRKGISVLGFWLVDGGLARPCKVVDR